MANLQNVTLSGQLIAAPQQAFNQHPWSLNSKMSIEELLGTSHGEHVKKYEVLAIDEDLLALSTAWKRLRDAHANGGTYVPVSKLLDKELFNHVTTDDHEQAKAIRDYYSKKIMMWKLKEIKLSNFREDMNSFVHSNGRMFRDNMVPLAYRLPEFYEYDVNFDTLIAEHNKVIKDKTKSQTKTLELKKTFKIGKKYSKRKEYWFSDEDNNLITFSLMHDNPLISLLDNQCKNPITLSGLYNVRHRDNNQYFLVEKYSFL